MPIKSQLSQLYRFIILLGTCFFYILTIRTRSLLSIKPQATEDVLLTNRLNNDFLASTPINCFRYMFFLFLMK